MEVGDALTPEAAAATVSMQFCNMCNNLLHAQEEKGHNGEPGRLVYKCRMCATQQQAASQRVMRHELAKVEEDRTIVQYDVGSDPTLPRTEAVCPACGHGQAAFFQSYGTGRDTKMTIYLVCCDSGCNNRWTHTVEEEEENDGDDLL